MLMEFAKFFSKCCVEIVEEINGFFQISIGRNVEET
jgi:hypothetical protein